MICDEPITTLIERGHRSNRFCSIYTKINTSNTYSLEYKGYTIVLFSTLPEHKIKKHYDGKGK